MPSSTILGTPQALAQRARAIFLGVLPPPYETICLSSAIHPYFLHSQLAYTPFPATQEPRTASGSLGGVLHCHWHGANGLNNNRTR